MLIEIVIFIFLIFLAGFLSSAEIAIASFGSNKIEELKEKNDPLASAFEKIQSDNNSFFGAVQISTNLSLTAAAILGFYLLVIIINPALENSSVNFFSNYSIIIAFIVSLLIVSFLTMVFGILIPKVLGFKYAEVIGRSTVYFFIVLTKIFKYPVKMINYFSNMLLKPFNEKTNFSQTRLSEDEIRIILSEGVETGAIDKTEHEIIDNIFEFVDLRVNEVMVPRTEMVAVDLKEEFETVVQKIIQTGHSLIPAFEDSADNIVGVIHTKDFMRAYIAGRNPDLRKLVRPAYFVPESKLISEILKEMQKRGERIAIVTDEYGGTEGVITLEDILEEIVGDIKDNSKSEQKEYSRLPDGTYYVLGSMSIDDFDETFSAKLPESEEYNTVAGFVSFKTGKILNAGENFEFEGLTFELIKKIRQKMVQFKIYSDKETFHEIPKS